MKTIDMTRNRHAGRRGKTLRRLGQALVMVAMISGLSSTGTAASLTYTTSWIGNTYGYGDGRWVPYNIRAIYVRPDGTVYSNAPWDESGAEISVFKDGAVIGNAGHTHGWGNEGGDAITGNAHYLFAAVRLGNEGGHLKLFNYWPDKGRVWYGITRRAIDDVESGKSFEGGKGNFGSKVAQSFLVINEVADTPATIIDVTKPYVTGLAATDEELFVSNYLQDRIEVYDTETMQKKREWSAPHPEALALAADGRSVWVIHATGAGEAKAVDRYDGDGHHMQSLRLPAGADPSTIAVDGDGRVLVGNNGVDQQILVYAPGTGNAVVATIGVKGGILAPPRGTPGPMRFNGLSGIGVDAKNNLYVAGNGVGPRPFMPTGTTLESYSPNGNRRWSLDGLLFVDGVDVDRSDPATVYSNMQRFKMDYSKPAGKEWRWDGILTDRFKYPESAMLHLTHGGNSAPMIRKIQGHSFLFTTDMYSQILGIYRFDNQHDGSIAIPSGVISRKTLSGDWPRFQPASAGWIWRDTDGNGAFGANEYTSDPEGADSSSCAGWWVDSKGGIWEARGKSRIRYMPFQGVDAHGNPMYDFAQAKEFDLPKPFTQVNRVQYNTDNDTLYIVGYTADAPYSNIAWKEAGRVLARYDGWLRGTKKYRYDIHFTWNLESKPIQTIMSVYQEHDYIFAVEPVLARVHVYDSATGQEIGLIVPGKEVGEASGWVDTTQGISAYRRPDGEYLIYVEEDARAKVLMYRWKP